MDEKNGFIPVDGDKAEISPRKQRQKAGVIKKSRNQITGVRQLDPPDEHDDQGVEFFQPIYEGELIIGVIHKCSCGKTSELRFQYSDK